MARLLMPPLVSRLAFLILLLCAAGLFLFGIGRYQQLLRAEAPFALGAKALLETGNVLLPHAPQELPLTRPPLQYWLIALSYSLFGVGYGPSRLPSALCALGVAGLVYVLGVRCYDRTVALTAAAMLSTSYVFWSFSRLAMPDMLLTLCVTGAVTAWCVLRAGNAQHPGAVWFAGYASMAAGVLTKGPIAVVLSVLPVIFDVLLTRDSTILKRIRPLQGSVVFLLMAAPYFVFVWAAYGVEPLRTFFIDENVGRFTGATFRSSTVPVVYELAAFLADFAPWSPLLILAVCGYLATRRPPHVLPQHTRLLIMWTLSPIGFFLLSRFKCDYYFLPAMPPAALLLAHAIRDTSMIAGWVTRVALTLAIIAALLRPSLYG